METNAYSDRGAFAMMVIAPLIYAIYYPQPYLTQILRKIPIAVVDNDPQRAQPQHHRHGRWQRDAVSRPRAREHPGGGAPEPSIVATCSPILVVFLPETERDVLKGPDCTVAVLCRRDLPVRVPAPSLCGIVVAIEALSSDLAAGGARTDGSLAKATLAAAGPADILLQPIFNPVGGYASYIVPAAFVLILEQTLLIGASLLTATRWRGVSAAPSPPYSAAASRT